MISIATEMLKSDDQTLREYAHDFLGRLMQVTSLSNHAFIRKALNQLLTNETAKPYAEGLLPYVEDVNSDSDSES